MAVSTKDLVRRLPIVLLAQQQVAERTHLAQPRISEAENGVHNITLETMVVLANAIEVEAWRLLTPPRRRVMRRR